MLDQTYYRLNSTPEGRSFLDQDLSAKQRIIVKKARQKAAFSPDDIGIIESKDILAMVGIVKDGENRSVMWYLLDRSSGENDWYQNIFRYNINDNREMSVPTISYKTNKEYQPDPPKDKSFIENI